MKTGGGSDLPEPAVEGVLDRARAGDREAFAELYRIFYRRVFGLCRHLLGSTEAAEDAASEVFLRAQRALKSYDSTLPFPGWLFSIASHYCVDLLRRRRTERRLFEPDEADESDLKSPSPTPLAAALANEQREAVRAAVAALPERYRLPLVLRYYSELSYEQIASTLRLPRNTVANLIFRAKDELRRTVRRAEKELQA